MKTFVNYYHLTEKELNFITSCEPPVCSSVNSRRLTRPVVLKIDPRTKMVVNVLSLSYYRWCVENSCLTKGVEYHIKAMY